MLHSTWHDIALHYMFMFILCTPASFPAYLDPPAYLSTCPPAYLDCLPTCLSTCLPADLPTCLPAYPPNRPHLPAYCPTCLDLPGLSSPTDLPHLATYPPTHLLTYLPTYLSNLRIVTDVYLAAWLPGTWPLTHQPTATNQPAYLPI